jgi:hypothetical protein
MYRFKNSESAFLDTVAVQVFLGDVTSASIRDCYNNCFIIIFLSDWCR